MVVKGESCDLNRSNQEDQAVTLISCLSRPQQQRSRFTSKRRTRGPSSPLSWRENNLRGRDCASCCSVREEGEEEEDASAAGRAATSCRVDVAFIRGCASTIESKPQKALHPRHHYRRRPHRSMLIVVLCLWVTIGLSLVLTPTMASSLESLPMDPLVRENQQLQQQQTQEQRPNLTPDQERKVLLQDPRLNSECVLQRQPSIAGAETTLFESDYVMGSNSNSNSNGGNNLGHLRRQKRGLTGATPPSAGINNLVTKREWSIPQGVKTVNMPLSSFRSMAVVNSSSMLCNGRADICDLRYNQVVSVYPPISTPCHRSSQARSCGTMTDPLLFCLPISP